MFSEYVWIATLIIIGILLVWTEENLVYEAKNVLIYSFTNIFK